MNTDMVWAHRVMQLSIGVRTFTLKNSSNVPSMGRLQSYRSDIAVRQCKSAVEDQVTDTHLDALMG